MTISDSPKVNSLFPSFDLNWVWAWTWTWHQSCQSVFLPEHNCVLQFPLNFSSVSEPDPKQLRPLQKVLGLSQLLVRDLVPVPHGLLQEDNLGSE